MYESMKSKNICRAPGRSLCIVLMLGMISFHVDAQAPRLSLNISTPRLTVTTGDEIEIKVVLRNISNAPLFLGQHRGDSSYDFAADVLGPRGRVAPLSRRAIRKAESVDRPSVISMELEPQQELSYTLGLDDFVDTTEAGLYRIEILWPRVTTGTQLRSNPLLVTVLPDGPGQPPGPDPEPLRKRHPSASAGPMVLRVTADSERFTSGKPVRVYWEMTNVSGDAIRFPEDNWRLVSVEAQDTVGKMVPYRGPNHRIKKTSRVVADSALLGTPSQAGPSGPVRATVAPGRKMTGWLDVSSEVDIAAAGTYSIQLWAELPPESGGGEVLSNVLLITIRGK